jgi:hypothetical protein
MHPRCSQARYSVFLAVATPRPLMSELGLAESDAIVTVSGAGISTIAMKVALAIALIIGPQFRGSLCAVLEARGGAQNVL